MAGLLANADVWGPMDFAPSPEQSATKQSLFEFVTLNHR